MEIECTVAKLIVVVVVVVVVVVSLFKSLSILLSTIKITIIIRNLLVVDYNDKFTMNLINIYLITITLIIYIYIYSIQ